MDISDKSFEIFDISQPVDSKTACFPGDVPFSKEVTLTLADSGVVNLTAFTMSPHVGSHADAPVHMEGSLDKGDGMASDLSLRAFLGPVTVIDLAPFTGGIGVDQIPAEFQGQKLPERILFRTRHHIRYDVFESDYAFIAVELAEYLVHEGGVKLIGLDTPSVDHTDSKDLRSHHILHSGGLSWLENLDLSSVLPGEYNLIALPLKFKELEASPVRAVLIR
ncbi:MAG: cyclase family protein [Cyanobacteria bacterium HKST-UBA01]|nr:cyclase family protein [Cyanobacteria bacterium HKST-UBA01]